MFHVEQFVAVEDSRVMGMTNHRCCAGSEHDEKCSTWNIPHDPRAVGLGIVRIVPRGTN